MTTIIRASARFFEIFCTWVTAGTRWAGTVYTWLERAVNRGDDIYLATFHTIKSEIIDNLGRPIGAFGYELRYIVQRGCKPKNISHELWNTYQTWFK